MNTITKINREQLKSKLEHGAGVKLVMAMNAWAYQSAHIPGSVYLDSFEETLKTLDPKDEIVVYDTGKLCPASTRAYWQLKRYGFANVVEYDGGLMDWEAAGYPLEGTMVH